MERLNPKKLALANDVSTSMIYSCVFNNAKVEFNEGESREGKIYKSKEGESSTPKSK